MFGVYNTEDDEMFTMNDEQVWYYLDEKSPTFPRYSTVSNGETVIITEHSAGANGKLAEYTLEEFFHTFEESDGIIVRPIQKHN